jgi:hypothetical protein
MHREDSRSRLLAQRQRMYKQQGCSGWQKCAEQWGWLGKLYHMGGVKQQLQIVGSVPFSRPTSQVMYKFPGAGEPVWLSGVAVIYGAFDCFWRPQRTDVACASCATGGAVPQNESSSLHQPLCKGGHDHRRQAEAALRGGNGWAEQAEHGRERGGWQRQGRGKAEARQRQGRGTMLAPGSWACLAGAGRQR